MPHGEFSLPSLQPPPQKTERSSGLRPSSTHTAVSRGLKTGPESTHQEQPQQRKPTSVKLKPLKQAQAPMQHSFTNGDALGPIATADVLPPATVPSTTESIATLLKDLTPKEQGQVSEILFECLYRFHQGNVSSEDHESVSSIPDILKKGTQRVQERLKALVPEASEDSLLWSRELLQKLVPIKTTTAPHRGIGKQPQLKIFANTLLDAFTESDKSLGLAFQKKLNIIRWVEGDTVVKLGDLLQSPETRSKQKVTFDKTTTVSVVPSNDDKNTYLRRKSFKGPLN